MENAINTLRIQNFKSIKDVTMQPRRVNLIIGQPNVGKSNILEAMSLLGGMVYEHKDKFMESFIRYEEPRQMFYDNLISKVVKIETQKEVSVLLFNKGLKKFEYFFGNSSMYKYLSGNENSLNNLLLDYNVEVAVMKGIPHGRVKMKDLAEIDCEKLLYAAFDRDGLYKKENDRKPVNIFMDNKYDVPPKLYYYIKSASVDQDNGYSYLCPPNGDNMISVIQNSNALRKEIYDLFFKYGLRLLLRVDERRIEIVKDLDGVIYSYPYSSIADTLQRIIFYLAAIESNDDSVLLFEEPEAHQFPAYTAMLGRKIVESGNNQFFIATHSPYLVTEILEQMVPDEEQASELAIFLAYYEDYQTKVKQLSDEEVRDIRGDSVDIFYNMARFTPRPVNG